MSKAKTKAKGSGVDRRVLQSLSHPLRLRILHELNADVRSPSELAREFDEPVPNVSYHVKILLENGAIELVKTQPVRGALEHFYRATMRPQIDDDLFAQLPASARRALAAEGFEQVWDEVTAAAASDGLDDLRTHVSTTRLELDDRAYEELADHLAATIDLALRLEAESRHRQEDGELPAHSTRLALMHFHRGTVDKQRKRS
jgi:DNA-binding transcriptional ArsR family regulator